MCVLRRTAAKWRAGQRRKTKQDVVLAGACRKPRAQEQLAELLPPSGKAAALCTSCQAIHDHGLDCSGQWHGDSQARRSTWFRATLLRTAVRAGSQHSPQLAQGALLAGEDLGGKPTASTTSLLP